MVTSPFVAFVQGAAAGAAGSTALNAATYVDMVVRARPSSDTPQQLVAAAADRAGVDIPGDGNERENRLAGLGPLSGIAVGALVGSVAGLAHRVLARRGRHVPAPVAVVLIGAAAMALSDVPLKLLGVSDPSTWRRADWISDGVPHLVYGAVTYATIRATDS
jgi:hypothetical protein